MSSTAVFQISSNVLCRYSGPTAHLTFLDSEDRRLFKFAGSAPVICKFLGAAHTLEELRSHLLAQWPTCSEQDWQDVQAFLSQLCELGLLLESKR